MSNQIEIVDVVGISFTMACQCLGILCVSLLND